MGNWPALQTLDLDNNHLEDVSLLSLVTGKWPLLELLSLRNNDLSEEAMPILVRGNWPLLGTLRLDGNRFNAESFVSANGKFSVRQRIFHAAVP